MTVHHVDIFHCQKCGRVRSCEHEDRLPVCCGREMARAVANITYENHSDVVGSTDDVVARSHCFEPSKQN